MATTVVIPVWDAYARFLDEAVASVRDGSGDAPIVVVDNASSVAVPELPGTTVVRAPSRLTVGAARNLGLAAVDTEHVLVLDADDRLLPGTIPFLEAMADTQPAPAVACVAIVDAATGARHRLPRRWAVRLAGLPRLFAFLHSIWSLYPIQGCALFRTAEIRAAGGYPDADWGDDWVVSVSLAYRGRVAFDERPGRWYRSTPGSISVQRRRFGAFLESARLVRTRIRADPGIPGWARALTPAVWLLQLAAVYLGRPLYVALARARPSAPPLEQRPGGAGDDADGVDRVGED
jgi:glycosyltransferase involved in cell wall biosynthesis